jgi:hypothetical protein
LSRLEWPFFGRVDRHVLCLAELRGIAVPSQSHRVDNVPS